MQIQPKYCLAACLALLFWASRLPAQKYNFINFNVEDGLVQSQATALCQDQARHLWVGTRGGLSRFNGRKFTHFTKTEGLIDNEVTTLLCDRRGRIFVGTFSGISVFDGRHFTNYRLSEKEEENHIARLVEDRNGQIWALADGRVFHFKNGNFELATGLPTFKKTEKRPHGYVTSLDLDPRGMPCLTAFGEGIFFQKNENWIRQFEFPETAKKLFVKQLRITSVGDTLLATGGGLMILKNNRLELFSPDSPPLQSHISSLEEDANGYLWVGTGAGACCIRPNHEAPITSHQPLLFFTQKEGLTNNTVSKILRDAENNLWFATDVDGIFRFNNFRFTRYDEAAGLTDLVVMGIAASGGDKFIAATNEGLFRLKNGKIKPVPLGENLRHISSLHADAKGNLYLGAKGVWKYSPTANSQPPKAFTLHGETFPARINAIFADEKGAVWVGSKGLLRAAPGSLDLQKKADLHIADIRAFGQDTLLLTGFNGAFLFDVKRDTFAPLPFADLQNATGICAAVFGDLACIGTSDHGLFIFRKKALYARSGLRPEPIFHFTKANGLPSDFIYNILIERVNVPVEPPPLPSAEPTPNNQQPTNNSTIQPSGNQPINSSTHQPSTVLRVWLGTGYGISCLMLNDDLSIQRVTNYGKTDGLTGMESNRNASFQDADGSLWFGLTGGLFHFQNDQPAVAAAVPPVVSLAAVSVSSKEVADSSLFENTDVWTGVPLGLCLNHRQNHLTFELDGVLLRNPAQVLYKYKLEGLDKDFTVTANPVVVYSSLPPGRFIFRAFALTPDSLQSENAIAYPFEITAPFYQRIGVQVLAGACLLAFGAGLIRWNMRRRERQRRQLEQLRTEEFNRLRKRTAEDFHDEMGNKLTRIAVLSDILKLKIRPENPEASQLVEQIKDNVGALYSGSRDIIWSLHPGHDELWTVVEHLRETGRKLFSETDTAFEFRNESTDFQPVKISLDFSRNLQMIAKEVFGNALRHAQATTVGLEISRRDEGLVLAFFDNGKGFDLAAPPSGNGLKNLQNRAQRLGATLDLFSEKGSGTRIELLLNLGG